MGAVNMERYNQFIEASRSSLGVVLGDLVDVAAWGIVPCVSKIVCALSLALRSLSGTLVSYGDSAVTRTSGRGHLAET